MASMRWLWLTANGCACPLATSLVSPAWAAMSQRSTGSSRPSTVEGREREGIQLFQRQAGHQPLAAIPSVLAPDWQAQQAALVLARDMAPGAASSSLTAASALRDSCMSTSQSRHALGASLAGLAGGRLELEDRGRWRHAESAWAKRWAAQRGPVAAAAPRGLWSPSWRGERAATTGPMHMASSSPSLCTIQQHHLI